MAYSVNKSNGDEIIVQDGTLNTETSLYLIGKNFAGYGEYVAEDLVYLLEHFANDVPPLNPTPGQMWYNTSTDSFKYWNGVAWLSAKLDTIGQVIITDTNDTDHIVTAIMDEGAILGVVSTEEFFVKSSDAIYSQIEKVGVGITLVAGAMLHGTATTALYADLAEMYKSDSAYEPGTVVKIGGEYEVTETTGANCCEVFGIVSTDPAYLMNSGCDGVAVALEGRVPCKVWGKVKKGDRLVTSGVPGVAMSANGSTIDWRQQVGRALEDKETEEVGLIEVVVGAK